jgi:hypothetical protein
MRSIMGVPLQTSYYILLDSGPMLSVDFLGPFQEYQSDRGGSGKFVLPRLLGPVMALFSGAHAISEPQSYHYLWLRHRSEAAVVATFTACLAIKIVTLFLEVWSKVPWLLSPYRAYAPETLANILDRTVLWWLGPLFLLAYQQNLRFEDLYAIDCSLLSESLEHRFMHYWSRFHNLALHMFLVRF